MAFCDRAQSKLEIYGHRTGCVMKTHLKFMKAKGILHSKLAICGKAEKCEVAIGKF